MSVSTAAGGPEDRHAAEGPGAGFVPGPAVALVFIVTALGALALVGITIALWPHDGSGGEVQEVSVADGAPAGEGTGIEAGGSADDTLQTSSDTTALVRIVCDPADTTSVVTVRRSDSDAVGCAQLPLMGPFLIWGEHRLLLLVLLGGSLGGLIHALRSLAWYIGNRRLVWSWLVYYATLPMIGSLLALATYVVIRGGFFDPDTSTVQTSPFGFMAMAVLVGMFSTSAALKLKDIAETILVKPGEGADSAPPQESSGSPEPHPEIALEGARTRASEEGGKELVLEGRGFAPDVRVLVNGEERTARRTSEVMMVLPVDDTDLKAISAGGDFVIDVVNPDGTRATLDYV